MTKYRYEHDSMGKLEVPADALWGAQTQRAINNFPVSGLRLPANFIKALALLKSSCAKANIELGKINAEYGAYISEVADEIAHGEYLDSFPIDIFQTGSGTSTNMNANEVIANLANQKADINDIHPNDHVNCGQSSNDTIPSTIHISACIELHNKLLPALEHLSQTITQKASTLSEVTKTGRTHLMDAMPVTMEQELIAWATQINLGIKRIEATLPRIQDLGIGGTAVGTGINSHPDFGPKVVEHLKKVTKINFTSSENYFEKISSQDTAVELSGQLKTIAVSLMKISNDLKFMNSGPLAGFAEVFLPILQPGSSIMPGKINPVIPESVNQVVAQVIGNDATIAIAGQAGNFQLNAMLPVIAYNLLQSIDILSNAATVLADKAISGFKVNHEAISHNLSRNPILVTALNSKIGYEQGAQIAKAAYKQKRPILEIALEMTDLSEEELEELLNPITLALGGE